jgi:hypothetical protein
MAAPYCGQIEDQRYGRSLLGKLVADVWTRRMNFFEALDEVLMRHSRCHRRTTVMPGMRSQQFSLLRVHRYLFTPCRAAESSRSMTPLRLDIAGISDLLSPCDTARAFSAPF